MKAGLTNIEVGTKVILRIPDDEKLNGRTGRVTQPFAFAEIDYDTIGIYLDDWTPDKIPFGDWGTANVRECEVEVITEPDETHI